MESSYIIIKDAEEIIHFIPSKDKEVDAILNNVPTYECNGIEDQYEELSQRESLPLIKALKGIKEWQQNGSGRNVAYNAGYEFSKSTGDDELGLYQAELLDLDDRLSLAEMEFDLERISTTSETSGYPRNVEYALIGFDTFEEAESCAEKYGLTLDLFMKKDGWDLWCRGNCMPSEELTVTEEDYGDDYWMIGPDEKEEYINRMKENIQDTTDFEDIERIVSNAKEVLEEMEDLDDNENLVLYGLKFYEKVPVHTMRKTADTRTYALGLKALNYK